MQVQSRSADYAIGEAFTFQIQKPLAETSGNSSPGKKTTTEALPEKRFEFFPAAVSAIVKEDVELLSITEGLRSLKISRGSKIHFSRPFKYDLLDEKVKAEVNEKHSEINNGRSYVSGESKFLSNTVQFSSQVTEDFSAVPVELRLKENRFNLSLFGYPNANILPNSFFSRNFGVLLSRNNYNSNILSTGNLLPEVAALELVSGVLLVLFNDAKGVPKQLLEVYVKQLEEHQYAYRAASIAPPQYSAIIYMYLMNRDLINPWISDYKSEVNKYRAFIEEYGDVLAGSHGEIKQAAAITKLVALVGTAVILKKVIPKVKNPAVREMLENEIGSKPKGGVLSKRQFSRLPSIGKVDAKKIRYSQNNADYWFYKKNPDGSYLKVNGKRVKDGTVDDLIKKLKECPGYADELPPIKIVEKDGLIYSIDNRRLYACKKAGVNIKYKKVKYSDLSRNERSHFSTINKGVDIEIRNAPIR